MTKLHMFGKLNLCRWLVVPSQKIQSDLYIALHKFLVNLYNHLERESLLASQPTAAMATSVTETAGLYEAVPGTSPSPTAQPQHHPAASSPSSPVRGDTFPSKTRSGAFPWEGVVIARLPPQHKTSTFCRSVEEQADA